MAAHAFNSSTQYSRGGWISEFVASVVYRASSKADRAMQENAITKS